MITMASDTISLEIQTALDRNLSFRNEPGRNDRIVTTLQDNDSGMVLATVSQSRDSLTKVHFLQAKGGFFAVLTTPELVYLALPGSQIQLEDTLLNMLGELPEPRENPEPQPLKPTPSQQVTTQAMILGAGLASRFVPVSGDLTGYSKPSVPLIGEDSVIVTLAKHLYRHGIRKILVNTFYKPEILKQQLQSLSELTFVFIDEDQPSGTAGGLIKAIERGLVDDRQPILVMQGDAVTDANLSVLLEIFDRESALVAIGVKNVSDEEVSQMAVVVTDQSGDDAESGYVLSFKEKPTLAEAGNNRLASIGFYVLSPHIFENFVQLGQKFWQENGEFDYAFHFFPALLESQQQSIYAQMIPQPFYWSDIGRPDQYLATVRDIYEGKLKIELPENAGQYFKNGVVYWGEAQKTAASQQAILNGNLIVFKPVA